jgi:gluconolactonase
VVVDGIRFGEGPVWCPADQTLVVTSVVDGALYRVEPFAGRSRLLADTGGGANGAALASDGSILVTQNGGVDLSAMAGLLGDSPRSSRTATPGLQRAMPDGTVTYLADAGFLAPNDLVVDAGGTVFFTDPGHYPPPEGERPGRVMAYRPDGTVETVADRFWYCNGIALDLDANLVVIEGAGLQRLEPDGSREWVVERLGRGGGDGFCLDADGRYYVAATVEHGVRVIEDGAEVDFLEIEGRGVTTNCCFGGPDNRLLFATDAIPGRVVVWEGLPTPGLPLHPWPAPSP